MMKDLLDFDSHLKEIMNWHFSTQTGTPFWLKMSETFDFEPLKDINTFADLARFPDVTDLLREVPVESLIPCGLRDEKIAGVFESGGTTGKAKRIVVFQAWLDELVAWRLGHRSSGDDRDTGNTLALVPTGPHIVGAITRCRALTKGGLFFTVDLDPRWVKKCIQKNDMDSMQAYAEHIIEQAEDVFFTQSIQYLIVTPPILERMTKRSALVARMNQTLKGITWGGTHMDPDTQSFLQSVVFPSVPISASYGSTMVLGEAKTRDVPDIMTEAIFDSFAPYILFDVVEPHTLKPVAFGERGQVVMHHLSRYAFFPNIHERDTAIRVPRDDDFPGAAVSQVSPLSTFAGHTVIEGVY
ncbi:phenazine antibiotic biosynthesis protein [Brenneria alni]|uniref:Phenazine antibiotic biosynthesis protein n=1 Tax=Brenneria alni TaxID=71656 RepID=A0A421DSG0_9GAMM|nr:phenazine antibiotic biosynthesis protein [Brenneria alni]RLM27278.1 phenazine antibiotic biosynthesis protein [Brenneria alni]